MKIRKSTISTLVIVTGLLLVLSLSLLTTYIKREAIKKILSPHHSRQQEFKEELQTVDQIISHNLNRLSIPEENISLKSLQCQGEHLEWKQSEFTVILPPAVSFPQVTNAFKRGFSFFELKNLSYEITTEANTLTIEVSIRGLKTHRLLFAYPSTPLERKHSKEEKEYRVSIVIDDLGKDYSSFKELLGLNTPFTYSILPFQPHSVRIALEAYKHGKEVILHLPLEPRDSSNHILSQGTLLTSMDKKQLLTQLESDLNAIPYISGVSNHMGSKFTEDEKKMELILKKIKERNLYFLDSRTTKKTVGYALAQTMQIKTAERTLFIDNHPDPLFIEAQLKKLPSLANKNGGCAVAIGHPYPATIEALKKTIPLLQEEGITIVPLSHLVR